MVFRASFPKPVTQMRRRYLPHILNHAQISYRANMKYRIQCYRATNGCNTRDNVRSPQTSLTKTDTHQAFLRVKVCKNVLFCIGLLHCLRPTMCKTRPAGRVRPATRFCPAREMFLSYNGNRPAASHRPPLHYTINYGIESLGCLPLHRLKTNVINNVRFFDNALLNA